MLVLFASTFSVCFFFFYFAPILDNLFRLYAHPKTKSAKKMLQIVNDVISRRAKFESIFFSSRQFVEMNPNWNDDLSDEEGRFMYNVNQSHVTIFCIIFV